MNTTSTALTEEEVKRLNVFFKFAEIIPSEASVTQELCDSVQRLIAEYRHLKWARFHCSRIFICIDDCITCKRAAVGVGKEKSSKVTRLISSTTKGESQ